MPTSVMAMPTSKPRIGFSIDSIVGNRIAASKSPAHFSPNSESSERPMSPLSDCSYPPHNSNEIQRALRLSNNISPPPHDFRDRINRLQNSSPPVDLQKHHSLHHHHQHPLKLDINSNKSPPPPQTRLSPDNVIGRRSRSPSPAANNININNNNNQISPRSPPANKGPIVVPGIPAGLVRPFPVGPPPQAMTDIKALPPYINTPEMVQAAHNPHFLAAQFQAAAALAHVQAGQGFPPQHPAHMHNPNVPRDSYPLYPWLLSRHGRIFPHRFPGSE